MLMNFLKRIGKDKAGATAIEYGLIASLLVLGIMGSLTFFRDAAIGTWNRVSTEVGTASAA